jgi:glycerol kinase
MEAMAGDGALPSAMRIDGGMAANAWLCQFLADILQLPIERPHNLETTALGAAFLAGLATGVWSGLDALNASWQRRDCFMPAMNAESRAQLVDGWRSATAKILSNA